MAEEHSEETEFIKRGPYPGEEPELTAREGGWLYALLALAVGLTLFSVVAIATWPLAVGAWIAVTIVLIAQMVGKRAAVRAHEHHEHHEHRR